MRVVVTRPKEDSAALLRELRQRGIEATVEPMLVIRALQGAKPLDLIGVSGLLFTSSNGVRAFEAASEERSIPAYCVGDETARTARAAGFAEVHSAAGNVEKLTQYVVAHARPDAGRMVHVAGSVTAGDLAGALRAAGFHVDRVALYDAVPATQIGDKTRSALKQGRVDAILFFSPRTAATFVSLAPKAGLENACRAIDAYCLSAAVAERIRELPWRRIVVASEPTRAALLAALEEA